MKYKVEIEVEDDSEDVDEMMEKLYGSFQNSNIDAQILLADKIEEE